MIIPKGLEGTLYGILGGIANIPPPNLQMDYPEEWITRGFTDALSANDQNVSNFFSEHQIVKTGVDLVSDLGFGLLMGAAGKSIINMIKNPPPKVTYKGTSFNNGGVLDDANFAQKTYSSTFSKDGIKEFSELAGKPINTVDDLANALKTGTIKPQDIPIDYIVRDGNTLILNTRSSQALTQAGISRSQWNAVNRTGNQLYENMLTGQLSRNGLTSSGTPTVKISGGGN